MERNGPDGEHKVKMQCHDTYARSKQVLSLELQEQCVSYMKKYGSLEYNFEFEDIDQTGSELKTVQPVLAQEGTNLDEESKLTVPPCSAMDEKESAGA